MVSQANTHLSGRKLTVSMSVEDFDEVEHNVAIYHTAVYIYMYSLLPRGAAIESEGTCPRHTTCASCQQNVVVVTPRATGWKAS